MAIAFVKRAAELWRRYVIDNVPASGEHRPIKADIVTWGGKIEQTLDALKTAAYVNTGTSATSVPLISQADVRYSAAAHVHAAATTTVSGFMSGADKTKLDGVQVGAQANVGTNITSSVNTTQLGIYSSTGGDTLVNGATHTAAGVMTAIDKIKLDDAARRSGTVFSGQVRMRIGSVAEPGLVFNLLGSGINGNATSPSLFFSVGGASAAILDPAGVVAENSQTILTREKGDARYVALSDAWPGVYTGSSGANVTFPVGSTLLVADAFVLRVGLVTVRLSDAQAEQYSVAGAGTLLTGVWRQRGALSGSAPSGTLVERIA